MKRTAERLKDILSNGVPVLFNYVMWPLNVSDRCQPIMMRMKMKKFEFYMRRNTNEDYSEVTQSFITSHMIGQSKLKKIKDGLINLFDNWRFDDDCLMIVRVK